MISAHSPSVGMGTNGEGGVPAVRCDGGDAGETRDGGDEGVLVISGATGAGRGRVVADLLAQLAGGGLINGGSIQRGTGGLGRRWRSGNALSRKLEVISSASAHLVAALAAISSSTR